MQHLRGRIAKSDVRTTYHVPRTTYHVRTYASSTVSRHFGAETKKRGAQQCSGIVYCVALALCSVLRINLAMDKIISCNMIL